MKTYLLRCEVSANKLSAIVDCLKDEVISLAFEPSERPHTGRVPSATRTENTETGKKVLAALGAHGSSLSLGVIEQETGLPRGTASAVLSRLVREGSAERVGRALYRRMQ